MRSRWIDPERVRLGQRLRGLQQVVDRQLGGEAALIFEQLFEVSALEVLHDHVRSAAGKRRDVAHAHHVLAPDLDRGAALAEKARDERRIVRQLRNQELDGDPLLELDVRGRHHDAHAAPTELALDAVLVREDIAGGRNEVCVRHDTREESSPKAYENITLRLEAAIVESPRIIAYAVSSSRAWRHTCRLAGRSDLARASHLPGRPSPGRAATSVRD